MLVLLQRNVGDLLVIVEKAGPIEEDRMRTS